MQITNSDGFHYYSQKPENNEWVIARELSSPSAKRTVWQPLTRSLKSRLEVTQYLDFFVAQEKKKPEARRRKIFVVELVHYAR